MEGSIALSLNQYKLLLMHHRKLTDPAVRLRAHILHLQADGPSWNTIATMLYTSPSTMLSGRPTSRSGAWKQFWATPMAGRRCFSRDGVPGSTLDHREAMRLRFFTQPQVLSHNGTSAVGGYRLKVSPEAVRRCRRIHVICDNARFTTPGWSESILPAGVIASRPTFCRSTLPRPNRLNGCDGTFIRKLRGTAAVESLRNSST